MFSNLSNIFHSTAKANNAALMASGGRCCCGSRQGAAVPGLALPAALATFLRRWMKLWLNLMPQVEVIEALRRAAGKQISAAMQGDCEELPEQLQNL